MSAPVIRILSTLAHRARRARPRCAVLACTALALVSYACQAQRHLVIRSDPPGADVRLDGSPVGRTPLDLSFKDYGTRRVTLYKDGYLTHSQVVVIRPPWYGRFPFDLFSEVLFPVGWKDKHVVQAKLEPGQSTIPLPDLRSVLDRAEHLRRAGPEGPVPVEPAPAPPPKRSGSSAPRSP